MTTMLLMLTFPRLFLLISLTVLLIAITITASADTPPPPGGKQEDETFLHHHHHHHHHHHQHSGIRMRRSSCPSCTHHHHHLHSQHNQQQPIASPSAADGAVTTEAGSSGSGEDARLESIKRQILVKLGLESKPDYVSALGTAGRLPPRQVVLETLLRAEESVDEALGPVAVAVPPQIASTTANHQHRSRQQQAQTNNEQGPTSSSPGGHGHIVFNDDDFYGKTSEIIAFAEPGPRWNGQVLVEFSSRQKAQGSSSGGGGGGESVVEPGLRVKAAILWLYVHINYHRHSNNNKRPLVTVQQPIKPPTLYIFRVITVPSPMMQQTTDNATKPTPTQNLDTWSELVASQRVALQHSGWIKVNVTEGVRKWFSSSASNNSNNNNSHNKLRLLVDCSGCASGQAEPVLFSSKRRRRRLRKKKKRRRRRQTSDAASDAAVRDDDRHRPFLVIHTESVSSRRSRRRTPIDCSSVAIGQGQGGIQQPCCKQRFYVSFKALGWDDWIIAPSGYYANYCRGGCGSVLTRTPDTFSSYHTHVIDQVLKVGGGGGGGSDGGVGGVQHQHLMMQQGPCCAPTKFSSMSLIYFGPDMNIIKRDLPKMVVDECSCP